MRRSVSPPLPWSAEAMVADNVRALLPVGSRILDSDLALRQEMSGGRDTLVLPAYPMLGLPLHIREAAQAATANPRETPSRGLPTLREAIAAKMAREGNLAIDADTRVLVTNGAMQALDVVMRTLLNPHDEVLLPAPSYFFDGVVRLAGGDPVLVPMEEDESYTWDLDRIAAAITPRTKLLVISSPVNPTGYVLGQSELQALLDMAVRHNMLILTDESYERLLYDGTPSASVAWLPGAEERTIIVQSVTKSYALPQWRIGYIVAPAALVSAFTKVLEWEVLHVNHICQAVAEAALAGPQDWLAGVVAEFQKNRDALWPAVQSTGLLRCPRPRGGPFLFISAAALGWTSDQIYRWLLWEWGIPTTSGAYFHMPHHVRLAFGAAPATIADLVDRLNAAADQLRGAS